MPGRSPFTNLVVYTHGSQVAVQPKQSGTSAQLDTLSVDLGTGAAQVLMSAPQSGTGREVLGIMGLCKLHKGNALVVVTESRHAATLHSSAIFEVVKAEVITEPNARNSKENRAILDLLEDAVDPTRSGRGLHFSYYHDLTLTLQRAADLRATSPDTFSAQVPALRADQRFMWNRAIARPLLTAGAHRFILPCILGFVEQLSQLSFRDVSSGQPVTATLTLIARRCADRAGTRQWRRGADPEGNAANFVETEQILTVDGPPTSRLVGQEAAYVIVRGSIPLLWTQLPNIKYKPTTVIGPSEVSGPAHDKHFHSMADQYKHVVAVNLINHHGTEGKLEAAFRAEATRACATPASPLASALKYVAFDFHAECGGKRYHRLSFLWDKVKEDFEAHGFTLTDASGAEQRRQTGVIRVNCIDCLDRTNVVQGVLARKSLEAVLEVKGLLAPGHTLPEAYPQVEKHFKILWADHGDAISTQYAGTGAMKSGFTRTGKRTTMGVLDDGYKAVARYYLNNFSDGVKQDAIDLLTGAYQCDGMTPPPLKHQPSPFIPIIVSLASIAAAAHNVGMLLRQGVAAAAPAATPLTGLHRQLLATVLLGVGHSNPGASSSFADVDKAAPIGSITRNMTAGSDASVAGPSTVAALFQFVLLPLVVGLGLMGLVVQNGKHLVNKPRLCPAAAVTVTKPPKKKAA